MCPIRVLSKRIDKYKTIYYYFDNISDIYSLYRKLKTIINYPTVKIITKNGKQILSKEIL
jgi:hypothetical protein